jgi:hypothetical protein
MSSKRARRARKRLAAREGPGWFRRWVAKSKPTDWITSLATLTGVVAGLLTGITVLTLGFIEAKRDRAAVEAERVAREQRDAEQWRVARAAEVEGLRQELLLAKLEARTTHLRDSLSESKRASDSLRSELIPTSLQENDWLESVPNLKGMGLPHHFTTYGLLKRMTD